MFILPVDELSLNEMRTFRKNAKEKAVSEALKLSLATGPEQLDARGIMPQTDMGLPAATPGYAAEVFVTGAIAATTWTSVYSTGLVAQLGRRKVLVIYGVFDATPGALITAVRFRVGPTGTSTLGVISLEPLLPIKQTPEAYLSEPIIYTPDQWMDIQCYASAAIPAAGERLGFRGYVVEPVGENVS